MSEAGINKFFHLARERYLIRMKREQGLAKPWSRDAIFQKEYFCNVFREDDKTTKWFRENIRDRLNDTYALNPRIILLAIVAFRWFNRIETWQNILGGQSSIEKVFYEWDSEWIKNQIIDHCKAPYVTGAYIIKTPDGMDKITGVLWCIDKFLEYADTYWEDFARLYNSQLTMSETCSLLKGSPFLGNFMAYQIVCDARFTKILDKAPDIMTWTQPGPGCARGIGRTFYNDVDKFSNSSPKDVEEMLKLMTELLEHSKNPKLWPVTWPTWEMSTVQHWACETDKHYRASEGGRMKRKYGEKIK